jgi:uncharacterized protein with HEPN domain
LPFSESDAHLRDILESILHIERFVEGMDPEAYGHDEKTKSAVERKIQILTEAVIRLEAEGPERFPDIDWKDTPDWATFCAIPITGSAMK